MSNRILGIDCSSSCIGLGLIEIDKKNKIKFIAADHISPIKHDDITLRLADTRDKLIAAIDKYSPDHIAIENIIAYMPGKSSANTIITLATFNRMACLLSFDYLGKSPELFGVINIRHGLKITPAFPAKEEMPELVAHHLGIKFPWIFNKKKNKVVENFDRADAIAVALFQAFVMTGKCKQPPSVEEVKAKKKIIRAKRKAKKVIVK